MTSRKKKVAIWTAIILTPFVLFFSQTVGLLMHGVSEITTLGYADCRVYSEDIPMMTCSSTPSWIHFSGGTAFGDTFVTSRDRSKLNDELMEHEAVHKEQERHYGIMFIPLYLMEQAKPGCNSWEEEASYKKGSYTHCFGEEKYHK